MSPSADRQTAPTTSAYPHIVRVLDTRCFLDIHPSNRSLYEKFFPRGEEEAAYWSNRLIGSRAILNAFIDREHDG